MDFKGKAQTLLNLDGKLQFARIPHILTISYSQWIKSRVECVDLLVQQFPKSNFAVRSSAKSEDGNEHSNAGAFLTKLNVHINDIESAVEEVFSSYQSTDWSEIILIQPMLENVIRSGVAFSHDPNTCSPYRVVNWSENSDTSVVTAGRHPGRIWHQVKDFSGDKPTGISDVINLLEEVSEIFDEQPVDIEFAVTLNGNVQIVWLLQVRKLILSRRTESRLEQNRRLHEIELNIERSQKRNPFLVGNTTVFGIMPDWNPAEILGIRPKPLALSLYRELITDSIWAYQRNNYGYRNLRSFPLMSQFFGLPYVDVRVSFNSFIPSDLPDKLAEKLVNHYINRLISEPTLHDKVEFEIVFSCFAFDFSNEKKRLLDDGFSQEECKAIAKSLLKLTRNVVNPKSGIYKSDEKKIARLREGRELILNSDLGTIGNIYWLIEEAKRYGTLPFAGLARAGFIAIQLLKSLVNIQIITLDDYVDFLSSVSTVSKELIIDRNKLQLAEFLEKYGHLRPGTYDILSPRYDENPDLYFSENSTKNRLKQIDFKFTENQMKSIDDLLCDCDFGVDANELLQFIREGIQLREYSKFEFTKNLSDALSQIARFAKELEISKEDMSFCDYGVLKGIHVATSWNKSVVMEAIEAGKLSYGESLKTLLPPLITKPSDVRGFEWPTTTPNFITNKQITARVAKSLDKEFLKGSIVCIPNADPGFDWIFSYQIAGLITAWGGANSHMAIRANELNIPSVIGAGEILFRDWASSHTLFIDCANKLVKVVP